MADRYSAVVRAKYNAEYARSAKGRERHLAAVQRKHDLIRRLKDKPCADCGGRFPYYVMDFHHPEGRDTPYYVNGLQGPGRILEEVAKCVLLCSNCHRIRHGEAKAMEREINRESEDGQLSLLGEDR
jgi:hypothetical protein